MDTRKWLEGNALWGAALVGVGLLLLLQTTGLVSSVGSLTFGLLFLLGSLGFLSVFLSNRTQWWALFPTFALGFIGLMIIRSHMWLPFDGGALFLGGLGAFFAMVYATQRANAWAIIPGGVLLTLGAVSLVNDVVRGVDMGWFFFAGLAATFGFHHRQTRDSWSMLAALGCALVGALVLAGSLMRFAFPLALVAVGGYLLVRHQRKG